MSSVWCVVGNCFAEFGNNPNVILISDLIRVFEDGGRDLNDHKFGGDVLFVPGQGLEQMLVDKALRAADKAGLRHLFSRWNPAEPACGRYTHKRLSQNTLITTPVKVSDHEFEADLCVDERIDLLSDHVTGQHLPGMILVEAGRQMFIACFERHFRRESQENVAFLVTEMNNRFHHYAFPVITQLRSQIMKSNLDDDATDFSYRIVTTAFQAGRCIFGQEGRITMCRQKLASLLETRAAKQTLKSMQSALGGPAGLDRAIVSLAENSSLSATGNSAPEQSVS